MARQTLTQIVPPPSADSATPSEFPRENRRPSGEWVDLVKEAHRLNSMEEGKRTPTRDNLRAANPETVAMVTAGTVRPPRGLHAEYAETVDEKA